LKTKNQQPRSVHLLAVAIAALKSIQPVECNPKAYVFINADGVYMGPGRIRTQWLKIAKAAKLEDFKWHDLRHSCASFLAQNGASLIEIASVLGHKDLKSTQRYSHLVAGKAVTGHSAVNDKLNLSVNGKATSIPAETAAAAP
jgi:site-specific recombinase XerD